MKTWARVIIPALFVLGLTYVSPRYVVAAADKVTICHFPPGNPGNVQVITVGASAVPAHVANHNDAVCAAGSSSCCFGGSSPSSCTNFASDNNNCGACGNHCAAGTTCNNGTCTNICGPGTTFCGTGCANLNSDNQNCGTCGTVCTAPNSCVGGQCVNVCSGVCAPGTTFCGTRCEATQTDPNNCGTCGHVCPTGDSCVAGVCTPPCGSGQILCGSTCVNPDSDSNNCGACGHVCPATDACVAGTCTPKEVADSCLPASSLSVLITGTNVTAYVPQGWWFSGSPPNIKAVPVEGGGSAALFVTPGPVNSCSSNNVTGTTVCTGNSNDVYVINGATMTPRTATATGSQSFSGGSCETCGVAFDAATGLAWIAEGSSPPVGALQSFNPPDPLATAFGTPVYLFGPPTSENIQIDPVRKLILSANELNNWQIFKSDTGVVYNSTAIFPPPSEGELDSTAEDCSTGVALAPFEFNTTVAFANLKGLTFLTPGVAGVSPGTWSAPTFVQDFAPDFIGLEAGNSGSAVAPGSSHLAVITGEFGGSKFGVLQLPTSIGPADVPMATDWVAADVPAPPLLLEWSMGFDPHTVTAYKSPNDGRAYALMSNADNSFLVKVDMAKLLAAPRLPAPMSHTANPATIPAGTFTFIAQ